LLAVAALGRIENAEVRVRFVQPGGAPIAGVAVSLRAVDATKRPAWRDLDAVSDGDGRVSFSFEAPPACVLRLEAKATGCARVRFLWSEVAPGVVKDLGDVKLVRGGTIAGRVLDANGRAVASGWLATAEAIDTEANGSIGREKCVEHARPVDDTGQFRIEDLAPGRYRAWAEPSPGVRTADREVVVHAGEVVDVELRAGGAPESSRIAIELKGRFPGLLPDPHRISLTASDGAPRAARLDARDPSLATFEDLPPGEYRVAIEDPRFQPWSHEHARPGDRIRAEVVGNSGIRLEVKDSASGEPIRNVSVRIRYALPAASRPEGLALLETSDPFPPGGLIEGLVAGDATLVVSGPAHAPAEAPLSALQPKEVRSVVVQLAKR